MERFITRKLKFQADLWENSLRMKMVCIDRTRAHAHHHLFNFNETDPEPEYMAI